MDKVEKVQQGLALQARIQRRIEANRIIGAIRFRDHFSSHPGRHSWDLCGHPVYWWKFKAAMDSKYMEKIVVWTEIEEALGVAKRMSDKFVTMKRGIEECREPVWYIVDDLKTPNSRVDVRTSYKPEIINERLEFIPTLIVDFSACHPLETTASLDKLVEKYYEDDLAEAVHLVYEVEPGLVTRDPSNPQYLLPVWSFSNLGRRQQFPPLYKCSGSRIVTYQWTGMKRMAYVEIPEGEGIEIHDEKDLEKAKFYLEARCQGTR